MSARHDLFGAIIFKKIKKKACELNRPMGIAKHGPSLQASGHTGLGVWFKCAMTSMTY